MHRILQLPVGPRKQGDLTGEALARLQKNLEGVKYIIIAEFSVIGQKMFWWINRRCKEATGKFTEPFGGLSIVLIGDIGQLSPVTEKVCFILNLQML